MHRFNELSNLELYQIIQAREEVFIEEQGIVYCDCDNKDQSAWHILGRTMNDENKAPELLAYFRLLPPGVKGPYHSIGRVLTRKQARGQGNGKRLIQEGIELIEAEFGTIHLTMSAQAYLEEFYAKFGFIRCSDNYLEQGIEHVAMERRTDSRRQNE